MQMDTIYPVEIDYPSSDKLVWIRLAFLQSQLQDTYGDVAIKVNDNNDPEKVQVILEFGSQSDQLHWILTNSASCRHNLSYLSCATHISVGTNDSTTALACLKHCTL